MNDTNCGAAAAGGEAVSPVSQPGVPPLLCPIPSKAWREGEGARTVGGCWATCVTSPISPGNPAGNSLFSILQRRKWESQEETALWPWPHSW